MAILMNFIDKDGPQNLQYFSKANMLPEIDTNFSALGLSDKANQSNDILHV